MVKRSIVAILVTFGLSLGVWHYQPSPAVAQESNLQAEIHAGACDASGNVVADLTGPSVATGEPQGAAEGMTAATSYSATPIDFDTLLADEHSVSVTSNGEQVACGAVGGVVAPNGSLAVVLTESGDSNVSGVAFLAPDAANPATTNISLFLNPGSSDNGVSQAAQDPEVTPGVEEEDEIDIEAELTRVVAVPTPTPSPGSSQDLTAPIGTTLESQGLAVTIDSAYFDYGFANAIPRGGYKVLILGVTFQNVSDEERGDAASRFSGIDAVTGNTYDPVTLDDVGVLLTDGDLQSGEYVSGTALIEVQETATNVIIKYDIDILGDEDLYWS